MTKFRLGYVGKTLALASVSVLGTIIAACGGGGTTAGAGTAEVSPYVNFATSYAFNTGVANDDPGKWTSLEGGTASMGTSSGFAYGGYGIFDTAAINYHQAIGIQFTHPAALAATDYIYLQVKAPVNGSLDVSKSGNIVIQMGNGVNVNEQPNTARVFSVFLEGGTYNATTYAYANSCSADVTIADSKFQPNGNPLGMSTHKIALSTLTCATGTLDALKSGVKSVTVKVLGNRDTTARQASTSQNLVLPKVGFISFSL
jgi:hypothetical protein